jgi:hypothetical protein
MATATEELTSERLRSLLVYDAETGALYWRRRRSGVPSTERPAGGLSFHGYRSIKVDGRTYYAHRLAWLYAYGSFPAGLLDHKNCDRLDNRISNLREADRYLNAANTKIRSTNKTGHPGIYRVRGRWVVARTVRGTRKHIGTFQTLDAALAAYQHDECVRPHVGEKA